MNFMQTMYHAISKATRLLAISGILFLASCKKDHSDEPAPAPETVKLREYTDGDDFIKFQYDAGGILKKATVKNEISTSGTIVDFDISYGAGNKISELNSSAGEKIVPVYENGILKRADNFVAGERTGYTNYQFEGGNIKRATIYKKEDDDYTPILEFIYTYNNSGNVSEGVIMVGTDTPGEMVRYGHAAMQYDQKTNPLYAYKDFLVLIWEGVSKNNIAVEDVYDAQLVLQDRYTYSYTYKSNGLPEKADVQIGLPGQPSANSSVGFAYQQ
ncbi:MAG: hypothetical protein BGP14_01230 [Sphingobacteriales bacterium 44-15]|nr:MAG: hypothetical protein BGP14_01230 [Sphingobacteriales bacterium 44-15]